MFCPHCLIEVSAAVACSGGLILWLKHVGRGIVLRWTRKRCSCAEHH